MWALNLWNEVEDMTDGLQEFEVSTETTPPNTLVPARIAFPFVFSIN
jgi:hypothetical protein